MAGRFNPATCELRGALLAGITRSGLNALGRHLGATVRTGTFCSYVPDPRVPITWEL